MRMTRRHSMGLLAGAFPALSGALVCVPGPVQASVPPAQTLDQALASLGEDGFAQLVSSRHLAGNAHMDLRNDLAVRLARLAYRSAGGSGCLHGHGILHHLDMERLVDSMFDSSSDVSLRDDIASWIDQLPAGMSRKGYKQPLPALDQHGYNAMMVAVVLHDLMVVGDAVASDVRAGSVDWAVVRSLKRRVFEDS